MACSVAPGLSETQRELRLLVETSDHVVIGRVSHVQRRRWHEDDTPPRFPASWIELAEKSKAGEEVGSLQYLVNLVEFSEATAYLEIEQELFWTGLRDGRRIFGKTELIPIDLLRPYSVAGHGPCHSFPQTCPWDIKPGELVALAIKESTFGAASALVCSRVPRLGRKEAEKIRQKSRFVTKYDSLLPFLEQFPNLQAVDETILR